MSDLTDVNNVSHGHASPHGVSQETLDAGHEIGDVSPGPLAQFMIGLAVLSLISMVVTYFVFSFLMHYEARNSAQLTPMQTLHVGELPPEPRLQTAARLDWVVYKAQQDSLLATYGWADKAQGLVRLPVDRALEIMAGRPWPHRPGEYHTTGLSTAHPLMDAPPSRSPESSPPEGTTPESTTPPGGPPESGPPHGTEGGH